MFSQKCPTLHDLAPHELLTVSEHICHNSVYAVPIYECVKVFVRLDADGLFTYARHPSDLGTARVTSTNITNRFRNEDRSRVVLEALNNVTDNLTDCWPFKAGSASWLQLEILDPTIRFNGPINKPTIIFRRAVRLSGLNKQLSITSTPLIENMFLRLKEDLPFHMGRFSVSFAPQVRLKNIAGSGIISESKTNIEEDPTSTFTTAEEIAIKILSENFGYDPSINPGIYVSIAGKEYKVVSSKYRDNAKPAVTEVTKLPPLPIIGILR
jgi:hypothetical protein